MRTCVIFNPAARGDKARRFRRHLDAIAAESVLKQTTGAGDARKLAAEAVGEGFEIIVAAGGDGTMNEVLNGIADAPDGLQRARLGVLPLGTVNVLARELNISTRLEQAWDIIRRGRETVIDLPQVEYQENGATTRRCFAQLAGAGLDARAIELVDWPLKKKFGPLAYVVAGLKALRQTQSNIQVTGGGRTVSGELVLVGNGRLYGGPFTIFPGADLHDGLLDVRVFPRVNWLTLLRVGPALLLRRKLPSCVAEHLRADAFFLSSPDPASLEVDGESVGRVPAKFSIQRSLLKVLVP